MAMRHLASLLLGLAAASAAFAGSASAQQPIRIGASISLTGTYAKPGVWQDGKQVVVWPQDVAAGKARLPTPSWDKR